MKSRSDHIHDITDPRRAFDLSHVILAVTTLIALTFIVFLSNDNIRQRRSQARLRSELRTSIGTLSGPPEAQIGDIVPSFDGTSLSGKPTKVIYDNQSRYVLFIMSLDCDAYLSQIPVWNSIVAQIGEKNCSIVGMITGPKSVTVPPVNFELLSIPDMSIQRAYRIVAVPVVMVVSKNGRVEWVHYGTLTENLRQDLISTVEKQS